VTAGDEPKAAAQLEQTGDALAEAGEPAAECYRKAQGPLLPAGTLWTDREAYDARMQAFERLQQKLYALGPNGRPRVIESPNPAPGPPEAIPFNAPLLAGDARAPALPAWQVLAGQGRLREAAALLLSRASGSVGMGGYAALGYASQARADQVAGEGDTAGAARLYAQALENFLRYALFPARGDSGVYGYELARQVVDNMARLDPAWPV